MTEASISELQLLIDKARRYFMPVAEMTFFDVGMRGHYENPTTDLLAFFLDPARQHNLGDSFSRGLLDAIGVEADEAGAVVSVKREVATNGGRIDLVIEFEQLLLVVECKIYHHQNNPFKAYEAYSNETFPEKQKRFVILSIDGESSTNGWQGLSYESLVKNTRVFLSELPEHFGANKWTVLANDFLLHLDNFGRTEMNKDQFNFVVKNLTNISKLNEMERNFYNEIYKKVTIESGFEDIRVKHQSWEGCVKALRFERSGWHESHDCALLLGGTDELTITAIAWIYADGFYQGDGGQPLIDKFKSNLDDFAFKQKEIEKWNGENWWRCTWDKNLTVDEGVCIAAHILKALDAIDCRRDN